MGVKMKVSEVKSEIAQKNAALAGVSSNVGILADKFQGFCDETELSGKAYGNHQDYIRNMQMPTAEGIRTFCTEMTAANNRYVAVIDSYFSDGMYVDEDTWRSEYQILESEYNRLNSEINWAFEIWKRLMGMSPPQTASSTAMDIAHRDRALSAEHYCESLSEQLECLRTTMETYRVNIEKVGMMLIDMAGTYDGVADLCGLIGGAVSQLGRISVGSTGVYATAAISKAPFEKVQKFQVVLELSDAIERELGDEVLSLEEFQKLSESEAEKYMNRLAGAVAKVYPSVSIKLGDKVEIPIGPNMCIYTGISVAEKVGSSKLSVSQAIGTNKKVLSTWSAEVGNVTFSSDGEEADVRYKSEISDVTSTYMSYGVNKAREVTAEWGVVTKAVNDNGDSLIVTTNCGLKARKIDWDQTELEDYQLESVPMPLLDADSLGVLGPILLPEGAPVVVPAM